MFPGGYSAANVISWEYRRIGASALVTTMPIWPWQIPTILRQLMSDVARLDQTIIAIVSTFDAELAQIQAELSTPTPDLSAQIEALETLRVRISEVIPDEAPPEGPGVEV